MRENSIHLDNKIEIWGISYNGVWYEVHVDATEERRVFDIFAEYSDKLTGDIPEDALDYISDTVSKIDN